MTMIKKGTIEEKVVISSVVCVCKCGYTEMGNENSKFKKCPKCGEMMDVVSPPMSAEEKE